MHIWTEILNWFNAIIITLLTRKESVIVYRLIIVLIVKKIQNTWLLLNCNYILKEYELIRWYIHISLVDIQHWPRAETNRYLWTWPSLWWPKNNRQCHFISFRIIFLWKIINFRYKLILFLKISFLEWKTLCIEQILLFYNLKILKINPTL